MPNFGEQPAKAVAETPEEKAARLAGDLELAPQEGESESEKKQELPLEEKDKIAREQTQEFLQQQEAQAATDSAKAQKLVEKIKSLPPLGLERGSSSVPGEVPEDSFYGVQAPDFRSRGADTLDIGVDPHVQTGEALKEITGSEISHVDGKGFQLDTKIESGVLKQKLESAEEANAKEAFEYVTLPEGEWGANDTKNLSVTNARGFERALSMKKLANAEGRKKFFQRAVVGAAGVSVSGLGAMAFGGAGSAAALYGGIAIAAGGGGLLLMGAAGYGIKKLYDRYKEKKSAKNFMTASVANQAKRRLFRTQNMQAV